jgi:hypothetical protein
MGIAPDRERAAHAEYTERLAARRREAEVRTQRASTVSNLRLLVFLVGGVVAWMVFASHALVAGWLAPPILLFVALLIFHDQLLRRRDRSLRSVAFYERALARLEGRWPGGGEAGERFRDNNHPYAEDLDLFGVGSLYELLCEARTRAGEDLLANWLLAPAAPSEIRLRQAAVQELIDRLDLREDLARLGDEVRAGLHPELLSKWGCETSQLASRTPALAAAALALGTIAAFVCWIVTPVGPLPLLVGLVLEMAFAMAYRRRVRQIVASVDLPSRDLGLFAHLLERLEQEAYSSARLVELRAALDTDGSPPSKRIARLRWLIDLLDARRNQLFLPFAALLLWTTQLSMAIDRWRATCGPVLGRWIEAVGEIEVLCAFAGFAYEHPDYPFPTLAEGACRFHGVAIGHPLIPADRCVRNDVALNPDHQVLIVSGSNMSGKSTLLRTVGTNTVLGLAGAPVCAMELELSPLAIGASIQLRDSLLEGSSRFYAEILRLRQVTEISRGDLPALFLLDEILHGTNSHDRGIGAEAVVRTLVENGAIGLVTTHDLALTTVAEALAPRATNVHFQDHLEEGAIAFDYRMHPGVVTKSNALELMRAVGLEV